MSATDESNFCFDYVFIKFLNLAKPVLIPWIEVASGTYVPQESTDEEIVILTEKRQNDKDKEGSTTPGVSKSHLKKEVVHSFLESTLRETKDQTVLDYGPIEDFRMQPAGQPITKSVHSFLERYNALQ